MLDLPSDGDKFNFKLTLLCKLYILQYIYTPIRKYYI